MRWMPFFILGSYGSTFHWICYQHKKMDFYHDKTGALKILLKPIAIRNLIFVYRYATSLFPCKSTAVGSRHTDKQSASQRVASAGLVECVMGQQTSIIRAGPAGSILLLLLRVRILYLSTPAIDKTMRKNSRCLHLECFATFCFSCTMQDYLPKV